ncbi:MAG: hypothetical protein WCI03_03640 [bacterium]
MAEAALYLSNWQTLAAAVAEQAVVDLMDHHRTIRTDAAAFINASDFKDYLTMAGVCHTAAACRLSLRRRGILLENSAPVSRKRSIALKLPDSSRVSHSVTSENPVLAETQAPATAPRESHPATLEEIPLALPEATPPMTQPCVPGNEKLHGVEVIRL